MEAKTADINDAGMGTFGNIDVQIFNFDSDMCIIQNLDSPGNSFQEGEIDVFEGSDLDVSIKKIFLTRPFPLPLT